jgi:formylglycine-generating enzyme required for sulfatase activity
VKTGQAPRLRGGSWYDVPAYCRSALRLRNAPDIIFDDVGFRVVCGGA